MGSKKFRKINWTPTKESVEQHVTSEIFEYWKGASPLYVNEPFVSNQNTCMTRSHLALETLRKSNVGQDSISFIGSSIWNKYFVY